MLYFNKKPPFPLCRLRPPGNQFAFAFDQEDDKMSLADKPVGTPL